MFNKKTFVYATLTASLIVACFSSAFANEARWTMRNKPRDSFTLVAHRGAGDLAPENCLSSLELSWSMGCVPEVDVRSTKDGRILMFHDDNFARIAPNAPEGIKNKKIGELTFDEARSVDIGSFRGKQFKGEKIVTVEEIVDALKKDNRRRVVIDVKDVNLEKLAKAIYDVRFQVTLTTWNEDMLAQWAEICPNADGTLWMGLGQMTDEQFEARFKVLREKDYRGINRFHMHVTRDADGRLQPSADYIRARGDELRKRGIEFQAMPWPTKTCPNAKTDVALFKELLELGAMGFGADRMDVALKALDEFYAETPEDWNVADNIPIAEVVVMGHRGMGDEAPEGTLETFRLAWASGVCPEADVRTSKDGVIVSFHDDNFARIMPNAPEDVKKQGVKDLTYEELLKLDVGAYKGEKFKGQRIVNIDEIVAALKEDPKRFVFCDFKNVDLEQFAKATEDVHPQICLTGPDYNLLKQWKKIAPRSKTLIWMPTAWGGTPENLEERFNKLRDANFEGLDFIQVHTTVRSEEDVKPTLDVLRRCGNAARKRGILFETYLYVNGDKDFVYSTLMDAGVASFATDRPTDAWRAIKKYYEARQ